MDKNLDPIDYDILRALNTNSRLSVRELAAKVHRSPTPVFERLRRLESTGVIRGYTIRIDADRIGFGFTVFCNVKLRHINTKNHLDFAQAVKEMEEVTECYNVSGGYDYLLKIRVNDMQSYRSFVTEKLGLLEMVDSVQSVFVMETIKQTDNLI